MVCGLNPSLVSADAGFGYAGATNRFWKAALSAGVVSRAGNPWRAVGVDRVGLTDLVKRATTGAGELAADEYRAGASRVAWLAGWLRPAAVCFVGLEGWRAAVDRRAVAGWQPGGFGGVPAYVMPSSSGRNASTTPADLAVHLRAALVPGSVPRPGHPAILD
jgi:TDG/mug DNA glycosylase family protein